MAVWGKYGGRLRKKASNNPEDSPEIAIKVLAKGADPNAVDEFGKTALMTACGTGAPKCVPILIDAGALVDTQDRDGVTALHECFYRGNSDCLIEIMRYGPDPSIKQRTGKTPFDCVFIDNMHETLNFALHNEEFLKLANKHPCLTPTNENIEQLISQAIMYKAQECYDILLKYQEENNISINIDFSNLFARTLTVYNFTHWKEHKETRINTDMLAQLLLVNFKKF